MKKLFLLIVLLACVAFAQFKDESPIKPSIADGMIDRSPDFVLGLFDASKFSMHHSYSLSYQTSGSNALALGVYTNSMMYKFAENLDVQVDASLVQSPYSTFGKNYQNSINGIYLSRAALNYTPFKDFHISLLYQHVPESSFYYGRDAFGYSPFYGVLGNP
jgi:hypothetical protein